MKFTLPLGLACLILSVGTEARIRRPNLGRRGVDAEQDRQLIQARQFDPSRRPSVPLHARQAGPSPVPCGVGFQSTAQGCVGCDTVQRFDAGAGECGGCFGGYFESSGSCTSLAPICAAQGRAVGSASCGACLNTSFVIGTNGVCAAPAPTETCADPNATTTPSGACSTCKDTFTATANGCVSCISLGLRPSTQGQCRSGCTAAYTFLDTATGECKCNAGYEPDAARPGACRITCTRVNTQYDAATQSCVCVYGSQPDPYPQSLPAQCQLCPDIFRRVDITTGRCGDCVSGYTGQARLCVSCTSLSRPDGVNGQCGAPCVPPAVFDPITKSCVCGYGSSPDPYPVTLPAQCQECSSIFRSVDTSTGRCNGCIDGYTPQTRLCVSCTSLSRPDGTNQQCGAACVPPQVFDPNTKSCV